MISIIIPAFKEPFLVKTIQSILDNAVGEIEIFVNIDDGVSVSSSIKDSRVKFNYPSSPLGMRGGVNKGLAKAKGKYIMKCDAHCLFAPGFDKVLSENIEDDWLVIPRRYSLDDITWTRSTKRPIWDYHHLTFPTATKAYGTNLAICNWESRNRDRRDPKFDIDDTMTFQGSCWFANRKYFMKHVGFLDDRNRTYGGFANEPQEIGLKYWLGGGKNKVVKKTWYAHLSKQPRHYKAGMFSGAYKRNPNTAKGHTWSARHWLNNRERGMIYPFSWLVEKFWPVPTWPEDRSLWVFK